MQEDTSPGDDAVYRTQKIGIGEDQGGGQNVFTKQPLGAVEVGQGGVHQAGPLHQTGFEQAPVFR